MSCLFGALPITLGFVFVFHNAKEKDRGMVLRLETVEIQMELLSTAD